jgi:hypothetical protein
MISQPLPLEGYTAMQTVAQHAEAVCPHFSERARAFVLAYLRANGPSSGELLTIACLEGGIKPHDLRAFGSVYHWLSWSRQIVKVGECKRRRGHGTSGGSIWDLACR